jgi:hypothetical protein
VNKLLLQDIIQSHEILFEGPSLKLGKIHCCFQAALSEFIDKIRENNPEKAKSIRASDFKRTEFGKEINHDIIHWWIFRKESNIDLFKVETDQALNAVKKLRRDLKLVKKEFYSEDYLKTIIKVKEFTDEHKDEIEVFYDYVLWLSKKDIIAPGIIFNDSIWCSDIRDYYMFKIRNKNVQYINEIIKKSTEIALGVVRASPTKYTYYDASFDISEEYYNRDPEAYGKSSITEKEIIARSTYLIFDQMFTFFQYCRNALDRINDEINNYYELQTLLNSSIEKRLEKGKPKAFISHDSRDKEKVASHIAIGLTDMNCPVWYDEYSLKVGDNLRESIEKGLKECEKCILILSKNYLSNEGWPKREYDSIFTRENLEKKNFILPVWVDVDEKDIFEYSPSLSNKVAVKWDSGKNKVLNEFYKYIN